MHVVKQQSWVLQGLRFAVLRTVKNRPRKGDFILLSKRLHMSVPADMRSPRGLRIKLLNALLSDFHLLLGHALKGLLPVLVHVDVKLIQEVFWLNVATILIQNMLIRLVRAVPS